MTNDDLTLGRRCRDTVSGWEGAATARYEYMNGCVRVEISGADKDGKPTGHIFDVEQVEYTDDAATEPASKPRRTGGPRSSEPVAR